MSLSNHLWCQHGWNMRANNVIMTESKTWYFLKYSPNHSNLMKLNRRITPTYWYPIGESHGLADTQQVNHFDLLIKPWMIHEQSVDRKERAHLHDIKQRTTSGAGDPVIHWITRLPSSLVVNPCPWLGLRISGDLTKLRCFLWVV